MSSDARLSDAQLLVMAKEPVPGRVKTRLCPPATPEQAAGIAAAALADTLETVAAVPVRRRVLVLAGEPTMSRPAAVRTVPQRGAGLAERLVNAYADTALPGVATLLIGMDTPQLTAALLTGAVTQLSTVDAVFGPAADGGWWALGLREPWHADVLRTVPMSTPDTGRLTRDALRARGLRIADLPTLRDVDTMRDACLVAAETPGSRFGTTVRAILRHPGTGTDALREPASGREAGPPRDPASGIGAEPVRVPASGTGGAPVGTARVAR